MLLNTEKMKLELMLKARLPEQLLDSFIQNTCLYFSCLERDLGKASPNEAADAVSTLANFKEYFKSKSEWEHLTLHMLDVIKKGVSASMFHNFAVFSGITHVAFAIYELSITTPKIKPFFDNIVKLLLENLSLYLEGANKEKFKTSGNFEVIKGLSGPLRFLLNFIDDYQINNIAYQIVDVFIRRSKDTTFLNRRVPGWHYWPSEMEATFMSTKASNGCINYGLSHGIGGPLVTLSLAYKNGIRKEGLVDAIDGLISEYMQAAYHVDDIVYWPGMITFEQYVGFDEIRKTPNQMSWCYGSVGNLRAIYMSGVSMSNDEVTQFAISELVKIAKMNSAGYLLESPIVCHGLVGTAAIINLMYLDTGKDEFYNKTIEMLEVAIKVDVNNFFDSEKQRASERNKPLRASLHNYLEGYGGIINTILSIAKGVPSENEKRLLIV